MTLAVETHELTKRFRHVRSLRDVLRGRPSGPERVAVDALTLAIPRGEVFGLLGQNGAGKTTLVRMLTTLLIPTSGEARVDGLDLAADAHLIRSRIGLVNGDERSFYWRLTGRQNLEFFAALRHLDGPSTSAAIERLARRLGMEDHLDRPFGRLSTGQRQALATIRGLLDSPSILFMDEPTRSLDPISAERLRGFIREVVVGELERTVVLATHSMVEAEDLCGRLGFIQDGRLVAVGTVGDLRSAIGAGTRCELRLRHVPDDLAAVLRPSARGVPVVTPVEPPSVDGASVLVSLTLVAPAALADLLRRLVAADIEVLACQTREVSLEEIYVQTLTARGTPVVRAMPVTAR